NNPSISGGTVDEVMDQLKNVLEELREAMDSEEEQLAVAIDNTTNEVRALMSGDSDKEKDSDKVKSSILPHEPNGDGVTNVTSGKTPSKDEFWSDWS
ncbi:MAG: hypothetical protein ACRDXX_13990, partial [Stackebrandtia sp.]